MFEDFKGGEEFEGGGGFGGGVEFKVGREDIGAEGIGAEEVEAFVAHEADEESAAAAIIDEAAGGGEGGVENDLGDVGHVEVALNVADVESGDGGGIGFREPIGVFGLDEAGVAALVVGDVVAVEEFGGEEVVGGALGDSAFGESGGMGRGWGHEDLGVGNGLGRAHCIGRAVGLWVLKIIFADAASDEFGAGGFSGVAVERLSNVALEVGRLGVEEQGVDGGEVQAGDAFHDDAEAKVGEEEECFFAGRGVVRV